MIYYTAEKAEQNRNHPIILLVRYLATARPHLHFPPFACHPLLGTSVPFCFFDVFDPCGAKAKNKTTARVRRACDHRQALPSVLVPHTPLGRLAGGTRIGPQSKQRR